MAGERYLEKHPLSTGFLFMRQNPRTKVRLVTLTKHPQTLWAAKSVCSCVLAATLWQLKVD